MNPASAINTTDPVSDQAPVIAPAPVRPAYAIGHITVKDSDKWQAYCGQVPATLAPWEGEVLLRGQKFDVFNGEHAHCHTVVLRFPDATAAAGWHASAAYQALVPLRDAAADVVLVAYAG